MPLSPSPMTSPVPAAGGPRPPPSPASASRLGRSLESLPTELLQPIVENLVPPTPLTTRFALRPAGTWEFRDATHQWADWYTYHSFLLAFARTSRRMAAVAKPLLYHTLVIPTPRDLVTLFRRLDSGHISPSWIRNITCLINLTGNLTIAEVHEEWYKQTGVNWAAQHDGVYVSAIALEILKTIMLKAPNLQDLLLASPDHDLSASPADAADRMMPASRDAIMNYRTQNYPPAPSPLFGFFPFEAMRNLRSLRIYCHREEGERTLTLSRLIADYAVENLSQLTQLQTLELCCAAAESSCIASLDMQTVPPLPHIQHLRFYGSHIHEARLVQLCLACVNLQTLVVHFEASSMDDERDLLPDGKTLNDALAALSKPLRTLELVALSEGHYLTRGQERPRKPENHRLRCIPELATLETLTLDYRGVFGTLGILEEDDGERLCQLLPPSIRDFTLVCEWGTASDWKQSYLANLDMVLHGVECLCASRAHTRLSSISLAIHSWPAESRFHKRFKREVETARQRCATAGILFRTFDLLPSYQDEDELPPGEDEEGEFEETDEEEGEEEGEEGEADTDEEDVGYIHHVHALEDDLELEEEDEASEYYFSGDEESDPEREARRPPTFNDFLQRLGDDHGHSIDELFYAYHEDRWDEYLF